MFTRVVEAVNRGVSINDAVVAEAAVVRGELECLLADAAHFPLRIELTSGSACEIENASRVQLGPTTATLFDGNGSWRSDVALIHVTSIRALGME